MCHPLFQRKDGTGNNGLEHATLTQQGVAPALQDRGTKVKPMHQHAKERSFLGNRFTQRDTNIRPCNRNHSSRKASTCPYVEQCALRRHHLADGQGINKMSVNDGLCRKNPSKVKPLAPLPEEPSIFLKPLDLFVSETNAHSVGTHEQPVPM